jgi:hypothetical protein
MAGAAGYRSHYEVFFTIMPCVAPHAKHVKRICPMSDKVISRSGIFSNGAADKPFLRVTVAASKSYSAVTAIACDRLTFTVMVTVAALCTILLEVFYMLKCYRAGVGGRKNIFGTPSVNDTFEIDNLGKGIIGKRYANGQQNDSSAYDQCSCVHSIIP